MVLAWAYMLIIPVHSPALFNATFYDYRRATTLVVFLLLNILLVLSANVRNTVYQTFARLSLLIRILIGLFFFIGILSSLINAHTLPLALMEVAYYWMLVVMGLFVAGMLCHYPYALKMLLTVLLLMCAAYCILVLNNYGMLLISKYKEHNTLEHTEYWLNYPHFINIRFLTQFLSWALPLLTGCCWYFRPSRLLSIIAFITLSLFWYLAITSNSRALVMEYLIMIPLLFMLNRRLGWQYCKITLGAFIIGLLVYVGIDYSLSEGGQTIIDRSHITQDSQRLLLWRLAINGFLSHPLLGIGPLQYPHYIFDTARYVGHAHNFYLQLLCEWGIIATALFAGILVYGFKRLLASMRRQPSMFSLCIILSLTAGLLHAAVSGVLVMPLSQYTAVFVAALALMGLRCPVDHYRHTSACLPFGHTGSSMMRYMIYLGSFAAALILLATAHGQMRQYPEYLNGYYESCPHVKLNPNFWSIGWGSMFSNLREHRNVPCYRQ